MWAKLAIAAVVPLALAQSPPPPQESPATEVLEYRLGPFTVQGRSFAVVVREARIPGGPSADLDFFRTATDLWIRDEGGHNLFHRDFPARRRGREFEESVSVEAHLLRGREGSGLLLVYQILPSAPLGGDSWQVFGMVDGRLRPMSGRIVSTGELDAAAHGGVVEATWDPGLSSDTLVLKVWTGHFFIRAPVVLRWSRGEAAPACGSGKRTRETVARCRFPVEARPRPPEAGAAVRLFSQPAAAEGGSTVVKIGAGTKVEFLEAEVALVWKQDGDDVSLEAAPDAALKVRVDGAEGWVRGMEDLTALGLPPAG